MTPLQKLPKNVGDFGKLIVAKGFKKLPKEQKITHSGHTGTYLLGRHKETDAYIPRGGGKGRDLHMKRSFVSEWPFYSFIVALYHTDTQTYM